MNLFRHKEIKVADWIIDSVVQYVCSHLFSTPVLDFIEERCIVFDSGEENKFSYTDAHRDFGIVIDSQLGDFMTETGIKPNDFAAALSMDISAHQGVDKQALQNAFNFIGAVDDFLLFKSIMVRMNEDLNKKALEMLERSGMLSPGAAIESVAANTASYHMRESYTPPPPYNYSVAQYEEDGIRPVQLVADEEVETFVKDLSTHPQQFEDAVREQQQALKDNLGIELRESQIQMERITISDSVEPHTSLPADIQNNSARLYPSLDSITSHSIPLTHSHGTAETSSVGTPTVQCDEVSSSENLAPASEIETEPHPNTPISQPSGIHTDTMISAEITQVHSKELIVENTDTQIETEICEAKVASDLEFGDESRITDATQVSISPGLERFGEMDSKVHSKELVDEDTNVAEEVRAGELDSCPAEKLTKQWMEYAKDQQQIWKSDKETDSQIQRPPTREDLTRRGDYFKRQRDLLRSQRKKEREEKQNQTEESDLLPASLSAPTGGSLPPLVDSENEKSKADEAKKFRKALAAQLKREVVEKSKK